MQHLEYLLYSFDNQRVYSYFHSTFLPTLNPESDLTKKGGIAAIPYLHSS